MNNRSARSLLLFVVTALWLGSAALAQGAGKPPPDPWPRVVDLGNGQVLVYQPQVNQWIDNQIDFRAALAIKPTGAKEETFGTVAASARTQVDKVLRTVTFRKQEAAELALLPDFSLGLAGGRFSDGVLSLLRLNPWLATAAVGMSIPIYTGGALQAQVKIATAQQAQEVAKYGALTLKAFREVEDALSAEAFLALRVPYQQDAVTQRDEALRIAYIQYRAGRIDLLWVSKLQADQIAAMSTFIKLAGTQMANRIKLQQALGSSFDAAPAAGEISPALGSVWPGQKLAGAYDHDKGDSF
jgi:hypothetical protein